MVADEVTKVTIHKIIGKVHSVVHWVCRNKSSSTINIPFYLASKMLLALSKAGFTANTWRRWTPTSYKWSGNPHKLAL